MQTDASEMLSGRRLSAVRLVVTLAAGLVLAVLGGSCTTATGPVRLSAAGAGRVEEHADLAASADHIGTVGSNSVTQAVKATEDDYEEYERQREALQESTFRQRLSEIVQWPKAPMLGELPVPADVLTFPRIRGSPATHPIGLVLACRLLGADYSWDTQPWDVWWCGSEEALVVRHRPLAVPTPETVARQATIINQVLVAHAGTRDAYQAIVSRQADLILTIRKPLENELLDDHTNRVALSFQSVAAEGLVFIVSTNNSVTNLSQAQLRDIYMEKVTNWSEVGGVDVPIEVLETINHDDDLMLQPLMRERLQVIPLMAPEAYDDVLHDQADHRNPLFFMADWQFRGWDSDVFPIGYESWYFYRYMIACPYSKAVSVDGVSPSSATIRSGQYPLVIPVYAVIRSDEPSGSGARRIWDWLTTPAGQAVIRESGYVPIADYRGPKVDTD